MSTSNTSSLLRVLGVRVAKTTYPTGNPNFAVKQAFPSGFSEKEADPFLMCDYFGPTKSKGPETDPDKYRVPWHPHRGMDICTYLKEGVGRHADSMGNRGYYSTPGLQWISVGSGIEHAEGGGTPKDMNDTGFQLWVNVPGKHKMDDPDYGTIEAKDFPFIQLPEYGTTARLIAGEYLDNNGPFRAKTKLQMIDFEFGADAEYLHSLNGNNLELDNCLIYVYKGSGSINGQVLNEQQVIRLDADNSGNAAQRDIRFIASSQGMHVMLFAGKRIKEPIAWHGPFVMNTQEEIQRTLVEYQRGKFPPRRTPWNFMELASFPKDKQDEIAQHTAEFMERFNKEREGTCVESDDSHQQGQGFTGKESRCL